MKIVSGGRSSGKTERAIIESAKTGRYILVSNYQRAGEVDKMAEQLGLKIPYPVTVAEVKRGHTKGTSFERRGIIVDDALAVLQAFLTAQITYATVDDEGDYDEL